MRISSSLIGCLVVTTCASLAFGQASYFVSEPVLGNPVLLGIDENQPGATAVELGDPVLGSVILIAAVSDGDSYRVTNAAFSTSNTPKLMPTSAAAPRELQHDLEPRFEISIRGDGYFQVQCPNGEFRYTRRGSFRLTEQGQLITTEGYSVMPQIKLPLDAESVVFGTDGVVVTKGSNEGSDSKSKATLSIVRFENPKGLSSEDRIYFSETAESGRPISGTPGSNGFGTLRHSDPSAKGGTIYEVIRWVMMK